MGIGDKSARCAVAVLVAFATGSALVGVEPAVAAGSSPQHFLVAQDLVAGAPSLDDADGTGDADDETPLAKACRLIDALPYDPYKVTLSDADAIHAAEEAYAQLSDAEQQQLDKKEAANGVLSYGRSLQCASWGLDALTPVDDATTLADGTYTTQVTSTCDMGKTNSIRGFKFTATKVTVKDGHATVTLEHATASPDTVSSGGVVYAHSNTDETVHSTFDIPVDLNATFHISQMAKNRTDKTIAIPYEMMVAIDERTAVPDPEPSDEGKDDEGGSGKEDDDSGKGKTDDSSDSGKGKTDDSSDSGDDGKKKAEKPSKETSSQPTTEAPTNSGGATAVVAVASGGGGKSGGSSGTPKSSDGAVPKAQGESGDKQVRASAENMAAEVTVGGQNGEQETATNPLATVALCAAGLVLAGFAAFLIDYLRRDRKMPRIVGVRLSDARR
ncbi:MAG: hypothetical protein IJ087_07585 [Eggerthellaceae bacterium]|nr:hypothetical protein [Eggerthellaceae bacterium]